MTTAETRSIGFGIAGSLAVHLLLFVVLALWVGLSSMERLPKPEPEKEVTMVFAQNIEAPPEPPPPEPPPPKQQTKPERYVRTTQNEAAPAAPVKADFISDRNTVASAKSVTEKGDSPLPSTDGVSVPTMELANRDLKDGALKNDSAMSPPPPPKLEVPKPTPAPPLPKPEMRVTEPDFALQQVVKKDDAPAEKLLKEAEMTKDGAEHLPLDVRKPLAKGDTPPEPKDLTSAPKAIPVATPMVPKPEKDAFMPQTRTSKVKGTISNVASTDSVNAAESPSGRYMRQVTSAIEKKWHINRRLKGDFVEPGKLRLHFYVNKNGKVRHEDLKIVFSEGNPGMTDFTLASVFEAEIPPIPPDLLPILDSGRFEIEYDIVIY